MQPQGAAPASSSRDESRLRVVVFRDGEFFAAVCLEHYVATQGRTLEHVRQRIERLFRGYLTLKAIRGQRPLEAIGPAPAEYFAMYESGEPLEPIRLDPAPEIDLRRAA